MNSYIEIIKKLSLLILLLFITIVTPQEIFAQKWKKNLNEVQLLLNEMKTQEAFDLSKEILQKHIKDYGDQSDAYASTLRILVKISMDLGKTEDAMAYAIAEKRVRETLNGKNEPIYASTLYHLAILYSEINSFVIAKNHIDEALEIWKGTLGENHPQYAQALQFSAIIEQEAGLFAAVEEKLLKVKEIYENPMNKIGKSDPLYSNLMINTANYYKRSGQYKKAEETYTLCLTLVRNLYGEKSDKYATLVNNIGDLYLRMGKYPSSLKSYKQALTIREELFGKNSSKYASSLSGLSLFYLENDQFGIAEPLAKKALAIREETFGKEHPDYAKNLLDLGKIHLGKEEFDRAEACLEASLAIFISQLGEDHPETAKAKIAVAELDIRRKTVDDFIEAEKLLLEAANTLSLHFGEQNPEYLDVLFQLSQLFQKNNKIDEAFSYLELSKSLIEKNIGISHPKYGDVLHAQGKVYMKLSNTQSAEEAFIKALENRKNAFGTLHPRYAETLVELANLYWLNNNLPSAISKFREALDSYIVQIDESFIFLGEKEKAIFYSGLESNFNKFYNFALTFSDSNPELLKDALKYRLHTKALLFRSSNEIRNKIYASKNESLIKEYKQWETLKDKLGQYYKITPSELSKLGINIDSLETQSRTIEKKLSIKAKALSSDKEFEIGFDGLRNSLKENELAVEVFRINHYTPTLNETDSVIYAILSVSGVSDSLGLCILENTKSLESIFLRYYQNTITFKYEDYNSFNAYWKPLKQLPQFDSASRIFFSSDGVYSQINPNTLYNPETESYVLENYNLVLMSNLRDLIESTSNTSPSVSSPIFFGFPNYSYGTAQFDSNTEILIAANASTDLNRSMDSDIIRGGKITELPGTKIETTMISEIYKADGRDVQLYIGDLATETKVKSVVSPSILHIATHGKYLSQEDISGNAFYMENPLMRSVLFMAGAERNYIPKNEYNIDSLIAAGEITDDGILTAYEVMNMNLHGTSLVTLSACETGVGLVQAGEGVIGLVRAFRSAGAKAVANSLWKVSDQATQMLMSDFYKRYKDSNDLLQSFIDAQKTIKKEYPHPYYWGAFVLIY